MTMSNSEKLIRALYEITNEYQKGFEHQVERLLELGCERFNLEIGILSHIYKDNYEVKYHHCPAEVNINDGDIYTLSHTYCAITVHAAKPVGFEHIAKSEFNTHPAYIDFGLEAYIGNPIYVNGKLYGTFNFSSPTPSKRRFQKIDFEAMQLLASWLGTEISRRENEKKLTLANQQLQELSITDPLTELYNRRCFQETLLRMFNGVRRYQRPLSMILLDIDHFKNFNDNFGHLEGDDVLKDAAKHIVSNTRACDFSARFGGEEFVVLLPDTPKEGAIHLAEKMRLSFEGFNWPHKPVTASFGIATLENAPSDDQYDMTAVKFIDQADHALYHAKVNGRNQTVHYDDMSDEQISEAFESTLKS